MNIYRGDDINPGETDANASVIDHDLERLQATVIEQVGQSPLTFAGEPRREPVPDLAAFKMAFQVSLSCYALGKRSCYGLPTGFSSIQKKGKPHIPVKSVFAAAFVEEKGVGIALLMGEIVTVL